ncbi:ABC transporter permease [Leptospira ognonensis]|uniref:Transport permease protein n=1 Tax=Leptospira ognonensis TaxID=2484945 RepID=A0A4R9JW25_9LEPT|nr:ABC transporter permease [Leptospira ognonensis]TGL56531.1 ABC transporter permease [Leptospira ognonensis]
MTSKTNDVAAVESRKRKNDLFHTIIRGKNFILEIFRLRKLLFDLSIREFKSGHFGSVLGVVWIFVEPMIFMYVMWFFFTKAMRFQPVGNYPFLPWLFCSMIMWQFFSGTCISSANVFSSYSYLMKKPEINLSILPLIKILSSLYVHLIFIFLLIIMMFASGISFSFYWFQSLYYLFATCVLLIGISWITGSVSLFLQDTRNILGVLFQIGYWISPIFWDLNTYPEKYRIFMKLNPFYYIINGYRQSFIYQKPFYEDTFSMIYFWSFTLVCICLGIFTYKRLRPEFGDVI